MFINDIIKYYFVEWFTKKLSFKIFWIDVLLLWMTSLLIIGNKYYWLKEWTHSNAWKELDFKFHFVISSTYKHLSEICIWIFDYEISHSLYFNTNTFVVDTIVIIYYHQLVFNISLI